jgi:hypothetical protein
VFAPRTSSTPMATWFWQTEGRSAERVILGVRPSEFILLEFQYPLRRIFIGSHSLPPPRVRRAEPTCLSTPRRPHRLRPFTPALHLHQRKSSRNMHLQYSTKSQSTPRCQSLITPRSDHPPVVGRSGPQSPP